MTKKDESLLREKPDLQSGDCNGLFCNIHYGVYGNKVLSLHTQTQAQERWRKKDFL